MLNALEMLVCAGSV